MFAENSVVGREMTRRGQDGKLFRVLIFNWILSLLWKTSKEIFKMKCIKKCFDDRRASKLNPSTP